MIPSWAPAIISDTFDMARSVLRARGDDAPLALERLAAELIAFHGGLFEFGGKRLFLLFQVAALLFQRGEGAFGLGQAFAVAN